jgi:Mlc titration factor MtfA (ptsG expression regulator)
MVFQFFVLLFFGVLSIIVIICKIIEPGYMMIFNKPLYLYFYPIPKKLQANQKLILEKEFPFYVKLSNKKKAYFEHRVKSFISYYSFVGKEEMAVTDEMKIMIAGTYVMLTFGMRDYLIDLFKIILIYPSVYFSTSSEQYHKGEFNPRMKTIVFSWEDFVIGHKTTNDNIHLGLHEFSHALHFHCLRNRNPSSIIFFDEFNKIIAYYHDEILNQKIFEKGYFRDYALENQFEFIAVVLEHFFETPEVFKEIHPELYQSVSAMINFKNS